MADGGNDRVLEYTKPFSNGEYTSLVIGQTSFVTNARATTASGLNFPAGLSFDSSGNLWVVDSSNSRVLEFSPFAETVTNTSTTSSSSSILTTSSVPEFPTQAVALVALFAITAVALVSRRFRFERR